MQNNENPCILKKNRKDGADKIFLVRFFVQCLKKDRIFDMIIA